MDREPKYQSFTYIIILVLAILAHLTGLLNDIFISDSALYASIAKEMAISNNFLDLTFNGVDWLDKPHFPFWISTLSYKFFGINTFAYKFPAILFTFLALFYTYKLAKELYNRETALLAVLILATAEHLVISSNDVRAEPYLTGLIIASVYYYHRLILDYKLRNLLLASLFAACAIMTKGIFTLIPILGAVGGELILKRNWKLIFNWRWVFSAGLIGLFISPELFALYQQFDSHPEKIIFGQTDVSGIRFFLWDSQFGRFFNTGPIKGQGDPFFFLYTLIWAFLPWSLLMYYAIYKRFRNNLPVLNRKQEFFTISGAILALLIFSLSGFQLPHYTNVIFPFLAILTADAVRNFQGKGEIRFFSISQWMNIILIIGGLFILHLIFKPGIPPATAIIALIMVLGGVILIMRFPPSSKMKIIYYSCLVSVFLNFYLNIIFYPEVLVYQSGARAAEYANDHYPGEIIRTFKVSKFTLHFYADAEVRDFWIMEDLFRETGSQDFLLFTGETDLNNIQSDNIDYQILKVFDHYHTTMLSGKFLNQNSRKEALAKTYLLKILSP